MINKRKFNIIVSIVLTLLLIGLFIVVLSMDNSDDTPIDYGTVAGTDSSVAQDDSTTSNINKENTPHFGWIDDVVKNMSMSIYIHGV